MSTVKATNFQHPSSAAANITLGSDGSVVLPAGFSGGLGTNVAQTVKTDTFTTSSATFTVITGFSVTITPTSATSKILVIANGSINNTSAFNGEHVRLMRGATPIYIGDASSGIVQATYGTAGSTGIVGGFTAVYLDSPATASAVTYSMEARRGTGGTLTFNRSGADSTEANARMAASITAIEVAA
jgi:hypothetical protein